MFSFFFFLLSVSQRLFSLPLDASARKLTGNLNWKGKHCTSLLVPNYGGDEDSCGGLACPFSRQVCYSSWHLPKVGQMSLVLVREQDCAGSCLSRRSPLIHEYKQPGQEVLKQDLNITGNPPRPLFLPPSS